MYLVVDTWNGEGYSFENGSDLRLFTDKTKAIDFAKTMVNSSCEEAVFQLSKDTSGNYVGGAFYKQGDDHGSYQVFELHTGHTHVWIDCGTNGARPLTREEFREYAGLYIDEADTDDSDFAELFFEGGDLDGSFQLREIPTEELSESSLQYVDSVDSETEVWLDKKTGARYEVSLELVRDFNNAKKL